TLHGEVSQLRAQVNDEQGFETAAAPFVVRNALAGQAIVVVSAPGVDDGTRHHFFDMLSTAGATVSADIRVQNALLDPQQDSFLTTLVARLTPPDRALPGGGGGRRAVALLADALGTRPQSPSPAPAAVAR